MRLITLCFFVITSTLCWTQDADSVEVILPDAIVVKGRALTDYHTVVSDLFVVNKRTRLGDFGDGGGNFKLTALKTDTLIFGALGMQTRYVSFADSIVKPEYRLEIVMKKLVIQLPTAEIIAPRELVAIERDLRQLGYNEKDFRVSGVNAFESPITFLYQAFSKVEKSKRKVAELENMDRKRDLLKELFHKYIAYDIIDLANDDFDDFIDFIGVSDEYLRTVSQYDFISLVKQRYRVFSARERQMKDADFEYDKD